MLHHLRDDQDWEDSFKRIYKLLKPEGALLISDMVHHENEKVHTAMWEKYGEHLKSIGGEDYKQNGL